MGQSKAHSLVEQVCDKSSGVVISFLIWSYFIVPVMGYETTFIENVWVTMIFTLVSIARGYIWRRIFNRGHDG